MVALIAICGLVIDVGLDTTYPQLAHHNFFFSDDQKSHFDDVFRKRRWLGNSSLSHCSWELKTKPALEWVTEHGDPATTRLLVGIDEPRPFVS